jgi:FAD/FMN-containing dehydrogenase
MIDPLTRREFVWVASGGVVGAAFAASGLEAVRTALAAPTAGLAPAGANCQSNVLWTNYPRTQELTPQSLCAPELLSDVVALVRDAEAGGRRVHAVGSGWSFSDCALTRDYLIDTTRMNRELQTVQRALRRGVNEPLYHVEAGMTIRELYGNLSQRGFALKTMGGASGQTIAGAISTGTHGGDKRRPPLADTVRALHLVGRRGAQYWIEPSRGITNRDLLKARVARNVPRANIIHDDATFNACLVSLGCMGVVYAVVLSARTPYDLVERTVASTWSAFKADVANHLADPSQRFLQVLVSPYKDKDGENLCLVTTRAEQPPTVPIAPRDTSAATTAVFAALLASFGPFALQFLHAVGALEGILDPNVATETKLSRLVNGVLRYFPGLRSNLTLFYPTLLSAQFPPGTLRGSSFSVMDLGYGKPIPTAQAGMSMELHFNAAEQNGRRRPFIEFVDALIAAIEAATSTFFAGYVSLRFTGRTRALLGMQQWPQTCSIEISTIQGVTGLPELLASLYRIGYERGALPHWGQLLDLDGLQGQGSRYPKYTAWRRVYKTLSNNFRARTFENSLSSRWKLTTPP